MGEQKGISIRPESIEVSLSLSVDHEGRLTTIIVDQVLETKNYHGEKVGKGDQLKEKGQK